MSKQVSVTFFFFFAVVESSGMSLVVGCTKAGSEKASSMGRENCSGLLTVSHARSTLESFGMETCLDKER